MLEPHPAVSTTLPCRHSLPLSSPSDTISPEQRVLFMFHICTVASTVQLLPLGISTEQVLKGVLHICPYLWLCIACGSEPSLATASFSMEKRARGREFMGEKTCRVVAGNTGRPLGLA